MNSSASVVPSSSSTSLSIFSNRRYRIYATLSAAGFLWLFGLYAVFLSPAPISITPEMQQRHEEKLEIALDIDIKRLEAHKEYLNARKYTNQAKVWFWRFKTDAREEVRKRQIPENEAYKRYRELTTQHRTAMSNAKSELGVWTAAGLDESRQLFWESYRSGKFIAQRETMIDMVFSLFDGRDRDALGRFAQFVMFACLNFTTGMITALFIFLARLPGFILSFQPSFFSGFLFFVACLIGSSCVIGTFLALLYGSSIVLCWTVANSRQRAIEDRYHRRQERVNNRLHND